MDRPLDVAVVGAGQAGLAVGYHLIRAGLRFELFDASGRVGDVWRRRWDSLVLFTPVRYDALPGMAFPGPPDSYPTKDQVAEYLEAYAERFSLPVRFGCRVTRVARDGDTFSLETSAGPVDARQVVVATGPFQTPWRPPAAGDLDASVAQVHSSEYRNPEGLPPGDVLVVGSGNSGLQIAEELAATRRVSLSAGARRKALPQRFLGRDLFWWLTTAGVMRVTAGSRLGRRLARQDPLIGVSVQRLVRRHGVEIVGRVTGGEGTRVRTEEGRALEVAAVVWATGYRHDFGWIDLPVLDPRGHPIHERGVTSVTGISFVGLPWLHTRGSGLLGWVGRDAAHVATRAAHLAHVGPSS